MSHSLDVVVARPPRGKSYVGVVVDIGIDPDPEVAAERIRDAAESLRAAGLALVLSPVPLKGENATAPPVAPQPNQGGSEMNEQPTTTESDLVPIALIALEVGESVGNLVRRFGEAVTVDDVGMRAVPADAVREFFTEQAEQKTRQEEASRRRREDRGPEVRRPVGVPAPEGAKTGVEALMMSDNWVSPAAEFGRPAPNFLEEELAAGRRAAAEKKALVKKMKDDLS